MAAGNGKLVVIFLDAAATALGQEPFLMAEVRTELNPHLQSAVTEKQRVVVKVNSHSHRKVEQPPKADVAFLNKALCFKDIPLPNMEKEKNRIL